MRGPTMVVGNPLEGALELDLIEHVLELADDNHVALDAGQIILAELLQFIFDGLVVLVDRDRLKLNKTRPTHIRRQNHLTLRHCVCFLFILTSEF